jgi:ribosomal protein S18 acetylase RimI-like enzyme
MASLTKLLASSSARGNPRPIDLRRDLNHVADLMESCFADTLDPDGQRYLQQMRSAAKKPGYASWASMAAEGTSVPVSGYVWEEEGQIVGNLTLIPFYTLTARYFLIANVAVRPDLRRKGIATSMTMKAIEHARQRGAQAVWLHVREENEGAVRLYRTAGFQEQARRSTWLWEPSSANQPLAPGIMPEGVHPKVSVQERRSADWRSQRLWLVQRYPKELCWHLSLKINALRPDLWGFLNRFLNDLQVRQWSAWHAGQLVGVLAWQSMSAYADSLWLAASPQYEELAAGALLAHARQRSAQHRPLSLDYPAGRASQAIQSAGLHLHQTLIWMSLPLS